MAVKYATREDVQRAPDMAETARSAGQIDRHLLAASASVEALCHRTFYPWQGTRYFAWPDDQMGRSWRLWLDENDLISVTSLASGGVPITSDEFFLEPANSGPPFTHLELNLDTSAAFGGGSTHQRDIVITGLWGYGNDEAPAGELAAGIDSSTTTMDVTDSAAVGVGSTIRVDAERMLVTGKAMLPTGQTLQAAVGARNNDTVLQVSDGAAFAYDEEILLGGERMLIVDIAGDGLVVRRAWSGSTLAAHGTGVVVYAARRLRVERGALGTTAASHNVAAAVARHEPPALVRDLTIAETLNLLQQEGSAYARTVGSGDNEREATGKGLTDLRRRCYEAHGRRVRLGVV